MDLARADPERLPQKEMERPDRVALINTPCQISSGLWKSCWIRARDVIRSACQLCIGHIWSWTTLQRLVLENRSAMLRDQLSGARGCASIHRALFRQHCGNHMMHAMRAAELQWKMCSCYQKDWILHDLPFKNDFG